MTDDTTPTTLTDVPPITVPAPVILAPPRLPQRDYPRWFWPIAAVFMVVVVGAGLATATPAETVRPGHVVSDPNVIEGLDLDQPGATTTTTRPSSLRPPVAPIPRRELEGAET